MEIMDGGPTHRNTGPALNHLDVGKPNREGPDCHRKMPLSGLTISTAPLLSPTTSYPGPPPPYSCPSSATPSALGALDYISPPSSRRTTMDDKASGQRQSLPSIQEALGGDATLPFSASNMVHPLSSTSRQSQQAPYYAPGQPFPDAPAGPPNPFSQGSAAVPSSENEIHSTRLAKPPEAFADQEPAKPTFLAINTTDPLPLSQRTFDIKSPKSRSAHPTSSNPFNHSPAQANDYGASSHPSPRSFPPYHSPYVGAGESPNPPSSAFPAAPDYSRFNSSFKFEARRQSIPRSHPEQPYSDSVKRHLDIFDIEMALNEIADGSARTLEFARMWSQRAHQNPRSGQLPDNFTGLLELDDLVRQSGRVGDALGRIKDAVLAHQHALAEEQARVLKREHYEEELTGFASEFKENGAFPVGDSKKRRGKAAPPGRCHSCNRAETPEWRRGPDGARTLCNACGLHFAKLMRKNAVNKNASISGSNLRPKNSDSHHGL